MTVSVTLDVEDRDLVLLALAILSLDRPMVQNACALVAEKCGPLALNTFTEFRRLNADRWQARPMMPLEDFVRRGQAAQQAVDQVIESRRK